MNNELKEILIQFYANATLGISMTTMLTNLFATLAISLLIYFTYKKTYSGVAYAKSFNVSLIIISLVATIAMMMIQGSFIISLGTLGALSIVRFRNALKEPKDIAFMFWAIVSGLCAGTGAYILAVTGSIIVALILFIFSSQNENFLSYLLILKGKELDSETIEKIIDKFTRRSRIRTKNIGEEKVEYIYEIFLKPKKDELIIKELKNIEGIENINIIAFNNDIGK